MGSRWKGSIEPGAMPPLHQYLGTPVTTWILNRLSRLEVLRHPLRHARASPATRSSAWTCSSQSWEYASEMVLKSVHMEPAHRRGAGPLPQGPRGPASATTSASGWFSPWQAAWINLRAMFVYGADFFALQARARAAGARAAAHACPLAVRARSRSGRVTLSLYWMLLGLTADRARPAERLPRLHRPGAVRLHRARRRERWTSVVPVHPHGRRSPAACSRSGWSLRRCRWSSSTSTDGLALGAPARPREPPGGARARR